MAQVYVLPAIVLAVPVMDPVLVAVLDATIPLF